MLDKKSFTLVEILIVVFIIGILAAIAVPAFIGRRERAWGTEGVMALGSIRQAERLYYSQYGRYTDDLDDLEIDASHFGGRFYGGSKETITITLLSEEQGFVVQIDGIPGREAEGEWVEINDEGFIRAGYARDEHFPR